MQETYQPQTVESSIQQMWRDNNCFKAQEDINREKFYCVTMFPYPSGHLHMGHVRVYTIGDVISRYQSMLGKNVLQPMGWDAFGLPAENAAIKHQVAPAEWTYKNIAHMREQMQSMGLAYDWSREIATCDPNYYRWEQWFFLQLYKKGLVYKKNSMVNWDPVDQTVLANEQVENGRGWRSGALVERKEIAQWFLKITDYAEELLNDLDKLDHWPQQVKTMQRNWIGKSSGLEINFQIPEHESITIYTTRPDTLYGASFLAVALDHPLVKQLAEHNPQLQAFLAANKNIKVAEAELATMEKQGYPLGINAINPLNGQTIPVWTANFVLMEYGSGALMAVPAHDQRDHEFAKKYSLPILPVIQANDGSCWDYEIAAFTPYGTLINSAEYSGLSSEQAFDAIAKDLEQQGIAQRKTNYRLRDWGVSRQRYWGTPIPMINCETCGTVAVPEQDLPVLLPENIAFSGVSSPLKTMPEFLNVSCPNCKGKAVRETDTFDTFVESSWYYARYACNKQNKAMLDGKANYWLPVDQYVGGIEHAVLHLLYARFFHKLMRDLGLINSDEPFTRLLTQGMVLNDGSKMSKSKGNVVDPKTLIHKYGADTLRVFMMFAAPPEQSLEWSDSGVEGAHRYLKRLWAFAYDYKDLLISYNRLNTNYQFDQNEWDQANQEQIELLRQILQLAEQAKADYERQQYNTVVSACMKLLNLLTKHPKPTDVNNLTTKIIHKGLSILLRLLAPIAPHITQTIWQELNFTGNILNAEWPRASSLAFKTESYELVIQINGKLRSKMQVPAAATNAEIEALVFADARLQPYTLNKTIVKVIHVPQKLINIVVK